jgi:RNA polymerase sigma-70 factor (ECF subfamily)
VTTDEVHNGPAGYGQLDEATVLARLRGGDEALFREVVVQLTPVLTRLARSYTPTPSAAQDAVQDTWLVVLDKLDTFEGRSSLKTWICGILVNKARRSGLREHRTVPFSGAWRDEHGPAVDSARFHARGSGGQAGSWASPPVRWDTLPEDRLAAAELRGVIDSAIAALPSRQREVITARDVLGMDAEEAAEVLRLSAGNQRVLLHRARSKVRAALEQYSAAVLDELPTATAQLPAAGSGRPAPRHRPDRGSGAQPRAPGRPTAAPAPASQPHPPRDRSSP